MKKILIMLLMGLMIVSNVSVFANANTALTPTEKTYVVERTNFEKIPYMQLGNKVLNVWGNRDIITLSDSDYKQVVQKGVKLSLLNDSKILSTASEGRYTKSMLGGKYKVVSGDGYIVGLETLNPLGEPTQGELLGMFKVGDVIDLKGYDFEYFHLVGLKIEKIK